MFVWHHPSFMLHILEGERPFAGFFVPKKTFVFSPTRCTKYFMYLSWVLFVLCRFLTEKNTGCFRNELCGQNHPQFAAIKNTFTTPLMTCIFVMLWGRLQFQRKLLLPRISSMLTADVQNTSTWMGKSDLRGSPKNDLVCFEPTTCS